MRIAFTTGLREELGKLVPMAVVGVGLGVVSAMIMLDHPVEPLDVPMPIFEESALIRVAQADRTIRARAERQPFAAEVRAVGSAYLEWNGAAASGMSPRDPMREELARELRSSLGVARDKLGGEAQIVAPLSELRAYHADLFLEELRRWEHASAQSKELGRLSGALIGVLQRNGWLGPKGQLLVPEGIVRARYKLHWTSIVFNLDDCEKSAAPVCYGLTTLPLEPAELGALLAWLVAHPVLREQDLIEMGTADRATERRRFVYIERLAALDRHADPSGRTHPYLGAYPLQLARGVLMFHGGQYDKAREELAKWATAHPTDARARNWYLAAVAKTH